MGSGNPTIHVHLVLFKVLVVTLIKTQLLDVKLIKLLPCSLKLTYNIIQYLVMDDHVVCAVVLLELLYLFTKHLKL